MRRAPWLPRLPPDPDRRRRRESASSSAHCAAGMGMQTAPQAIRKWGRTTARHKKGWLEFFICALCARAHALVARVCALPCPVVPCCLLRCHVHWLQDDYHPGGLRHIVDLNPIGHRHFEFLRLRKHDGGYFLNVEPVSSLLCSQLTVSPGTAGRGCRRHHCCCWWWWGHQQGQWW